MTGTRGHAYDVFLSYNGEDELEVATVAAGLRDRGFSVWFAPWCLVGGDDIMAGIEVGLAGSAACAFFVGRAGLQRWTVPEYSIACRRAVESGMRMIPVILPGVPSGFEPSEHLPEYLATHVWVDLRGGVARPDLLARLERAVAGIPPASSEPAEVACPYVGLDAFGRADADWFVGREADVQRIVEKLEAHTVVAVLGSMGTGKSSVVHAGVLPALESAASGRRTPVVVETVPGPEPWVGLASALSGHLGTTTLGLAAQLRDDPRALGAALLAVRRHRGDPVLLVVDQFEEVFTANWAGEHGPVDVLSALHRACGLLGGDLNVLMTMRSDFLESVALHASMSQRIAAGQYLLPALTEERLIEVVEEPARRAGLVVQPGLATAMIDDLADAVATLPLLQQTLQDTWQEREGNVLTLAGYQRAGAAAGAVARRAEKVWGELDEQERSIARFALVRLVHPDPTRPARRRRGLDELVPAGVDPATVRRVLHRLADARLVVPPDDGRGLVDLTHEAVVRAWDRYANWVVADVEWRRVHDDLARDAQQWERHTDADLGDDYLYRGAQLASVLHLSAQATALLTDVERRFLTASRDAERGRESAERERLAAAARAAERDRQQGRRLRFALMASVVLASLAVVAAWSFLDARDARQVAEEQRRLARSLQLAAQATDLVPSRPDTAALLAREAVATADTTATRRALGAVLATPWLPRTLPGPQRATITAVDVTRDGSVVAGDVNGRILLQGIGDERVEQVVPNAGEVTAVAVDGPTSVVTGHTDGSLRAWRLPTLEPRGVLATLESGEPVQVLLPEPGLLVVLGDTGEVSIWSGVDTSAPRRTFGSDVSIVAAAGPGRLLLGGGGGDLAEWDIATGTPVTTVPDVHTGAVTALAVASDGTIVSGGSDGLVVRTQPVSHESSRLAEHDRPVIGVLVGGQGTERVTSVADDGRIAVHDTSGAVTEQSIGMPAEAGGRARVTFAPAFGVEEGWMAVGTVDGRLVSVPTTGAPPLLTDVRTTTGLVRDAATASGGVSLFLASGSVTSVDDPDDAVDVGDADHGVVLSSDVVVTSRGGRVTVHGAGGGAAMVVDEPSEVTALGAVGEDAVAVGRDDGSVRIVDAATGEASEVPAPVAAPVLVVADAPGHGVVSGHADGTTVLWHGDRTRILGQQSRGVFSLAVHDGLVAAGSDDRTVAVHDLADGDEHVVVTGYRDKVTALAFVGGDRLAVGTEVGERGIVDLDSEELLVSLPEAGSSVTALLTWPGVADLGSVSGNRVETWNLDETTWATRACEVAGRSLTDDEVEEFLDGRPPSSQPC